MKRPRLSVGKEPGADLAARVGLDERDKQTRKPVRQHADAPKFQRHAQSRPLLIGEVNRPARPNRLEPLDDLLAPGDSAELAEQLVPFVPGDRDDVSGYVDLHSVKSARFHSVRAYSGPVAAPLFLRRSKPERCNGVRCLVERCADHRNRVFPRVSVRYVDLEPSGSFLERGRVFDPDCKRARGSGPAELRERRQRVALACALEVDPHPKNALHTRRFLCSGAGSFKNKRRPVPLQS